MPKLIDETGKRFHRWTVINRAESKRNKTHWNCLCDCGTQRSVSIENLKKGISKSCGCLLSEVSRRNHTVHGFRFHPDYHIWKAMIYRCCNPNSDCYSDYGGRGISVCSRWIGSPENFINDMGPRPKGMTLERLDNNSGYSPDNCVWASTRQQSRNKRTSKIIEINGVSMNQVDWCNRLGLVSNYITVKSKSGVSMDKIKEILMAKLEEKELCQSNTTQEMTKTCLRGVEKSATTARRRPSLP